MIGISCIANSKSCKKISDIYGNCSSCYPGYITNAGSCVQCPFTGCLAANSTVVNNVCTCTLCGSGYYLTGVTCTPCSTVNCSVCPSNVCSACITNYYFINSTCQPATAPNCLQSKPASSTLCSICNDGYFVGSDFICYLCQVNCLLCSSRFVCTKCVANTMLINGICVNYPSNCAEAAISGSRLICTLCNHGYYL